MTADPQPTLPDPRTANDDEASATNAGQSATAPAEGADDDPDAGSAQG